MAAQHFADPSPSRRSVRVSSQTQLHLHNHHYMSNPVKDEIKGKSRVGGQSNSSSKLGTFAGVFVPTSLNVLSILMFLRFGMIIGQSGILGMMGMLVACYAIDLLTTMSISAIATNGTVRGGGTYYLISRSLGPEFGGAIGVVFYLGCVFNTGMNAVGLVDCLNYNFGRHKGGWANWLPDGFWWSYLWATVVLVVCTAICLAGSGLFARASNALLVILLIATFSIPLSALIVQPFESRKLGIEYTGLSFATFRSNLFPKLTKGADGSQLEGRETWQDLFGILFPATSGIFAGASMSGDLKHPSKAIPKGTLSGLVLTFIAYSLVILSLASSITRDTFYNNVNVIQDVNVSGTVILLGEFATSFFSSLMGVIGSAKLLQALARDNLIPGLSLFGEGSKKNDEPRYAILITHVVAQLTMLSDINQIASLVTMSYLMTFLVTNLACFTLKIGSAPNFRPSFHYFSWQSAAIGAIASAITMFYVDGVYASGCVAVLIAIFVIIHYTASPKTWGDVSQSLIYHQVRKYLLRLRSDNVKFWRPSVLLLINDPRRQYKLIQFCNSLKKGALFILAHVIVTDDYKGSVPEAKRQQASWAKYIDFSKIKGFINISVSPTAEWGIRNMVLSSGLGGMRPNIVVMGFFNLNDLRKSQPLIDIPSPQHSRPSSVRGVQDPKSTRNSHQKHGQALLQKLHGLSLPTDTNRSEGAISAKSYVTVLEDVLLRMRINVAIAKGFDSLELPGPAPTTVERVMSWLKADKVDDDSPTKYIDLWPVQMSAFAQIDSEGDEKRSILTTNFDTYTLILQLGCILATVSSWSRTFKLRVSVFVEYESDVAEERQRVESLLSNLRIKSEVRVFWLASGDLKTYEVIVNGKGTPELGEALEEVDAVLEDEEWWQEIKTARTEGLESETYRQLSEMSNSPSPGVDSDMLRGSFQSRPTKTSSTTVRGLQRIMRKAKRRVSVGPLNRFPAEMRLQLSSFDPNNLIQGHRTYSSSSDSSSSDDDFTDSDSDGRAASANDLETSSSDDERQMVHRSRSFHSFNRPRPSVRSPVSIGASASTRQAQPIMVPSKAGASDSALKSQPSTGGPSKSAVNTLRRPPTIRHHSMPKFTSKPVPPTTISSEDGPGPSIMFTEQLPPSAMLSATQASSKNVQSKSSAEEFDVASANTAGGFPAQQALPLSFNDLPSRAQHLILNELMAHHSEQAAVLFTTLPSPVEGTCDSEVDSIRYLSDVEVLCVNLPPLLLVHSNTVTVTMSL